MYSLAVFSFFLSKPESYYVCVPSDIERSMSQDAWLCLRIPAHTKYAIGQPQLPFHVRARVPRLPFSAVNLSGKSTSAVNSLVAGF